MTILERVHDQALKYWYRDMPTKHTPAEPILIYAPEALGDLCFFLPVIQALRHLRHDVICQNPDNRTIIKLVTERVFDKPKGTYGTVIANFQCQWTPIIREILRLEIPTRIGHIWREKYAWVFNHKIPCYSAYHRQTVNNWLLQPFGIYHPEPVKLEVSRLAPYDVLIVPNSANGMGYKDWQGYPKVYERLFDNGYRMAKLARRIEMKKLLGLVRDARLVIGNDSGITKLADAMGIPAIQIHLKIGPCTPQVAGVLHGHNLVDPTVQEVLTLARTILEGKR